MPKIWPEPVCRLIAALGHRADELDIKPTSYKAIAEANNPITLLLLFDVPGFDASDGLAGYGSLSDFLANAKPKEDGIPSEITCMVTIGGSSRPYLFPFRVQPHTFDVLGVAEILLGRYEAKEKLPYGFSRAVASWLMDKTNRIGYGEPSDDAYADRQGKEAVRLFREAIISVSDVTETPLLMQIFDQERLAYSSYCSYITGCATRLFCRTFCRGEGEHFNEVLANSFEYRARELLTWFFSREVAYRYGIDPEETTYRNLPKSALAGAFAHLPTPEALPQPGPDALED